MRIHIANFGVVIDLIADIGEDNLASAATTWDHHLLVAIGIVAAAIIVWGDKRILANAVGWCIFLLFLRLSIEKSAASRVTTCESSNMLGMRITWCGLLVDGNMDTTALLCESTTEITLILLLIMGGAELIAACRLLHHGEGRGRLLLRLGLIIVISGRYYRGIVFVTAASIVTIVYQ